MSFLAKAKKAGEAKAPMITIIGTPGSGKTTLGGLFPDAIFMQSERAGTVFESWKKNHPTLLPPLNVARKKDGVIVHSILEEAFAQIRELITAEHAFKTLVVDSLTTLSNEFEKEIMLRYDVTAVGNAAGGYNKGFGELRKMHSDFFFALRTLAEKRDMGIVLLAHTGIEKIKYSPDEAAEFGVYSMDMHKDSVSIYVANCDEVLYIRKDKIVMGEEKDKKGNTTKQGIMKEIGSRTLITTGDGLFGYTNAKNRRGMPEEVPLPHGRNPILAYIPFYGGKEKKKTEPKAKAAQKEAPKVEGKPFEQKTGIDFFEQEHDF